MNIPDLCSLIGRVAIVLILCGSTSACMTSLYVQSHTGHEAAAIERILIARDGTTALQTRHGYYRVENMTVSHTYALPWAPAKRFIIITPAAMETIDQKMRSLVATLDSHTSPKLVVYIGAPDDEPYPEKKRQAAGAKYNPEIGVKLQSKDLNVSDIQIIPADFYGPDATLSSLPEIFQSDPYLTLEPQDDPTYRINGSERQMKFSSWETRSYRVKISRGLYWGLPFVMLLDVAIPVVGVALAAAFLVPGAVVGLGFFIYTGIQELTETNSSHPNSPATERITEQTVLPNNCDVTNEGNVTKESSR